MRTSNIYMILYDIENDKVRNKVADLLIEWGYERIQFSVFIGLQAIQKNKILYKEIKKALNIKYSETDKICCITMSKKNFKEMQIIGIFNADIEYLIGEKKAIII